MSSPLPLPRLDRSDGRALFRQIASHLRAAIVGGRLAPGTRLWSEAELIAHYGVARMTIRGAVTELRGEGLVVAHTGRGLFVTDLAAQPRARWRTGSPEQRAAVRAAWPGLADALDDA